MNTDMSKADTSDLSFLSLSAAMELDQFLRGEPADKTVIGRFADCLKNKSRSEMEEGTAKLFMGPIEVEIFNRAFLRISHEPIHDIKELSVQLSRIVGNFGKPFKTLEKSEIEEIKAFCLSLHDAIIAQNSWLNEDEEPTLEDELAAD
jgi:hypothetical protein